MTPCVTYLPDIDGIRPMRADRLLRELMLLHGHGRMTTRELARALEVSRRTILRDMDALGRAGIPVYAVHGPLGGFEILDTFRPPVPASPAPTTVEHGRIRRVRVRLPAATLQTALVLGRPRGWRPRPHPDPPDPARPDWIEGSFAVDSDDAAVRELLPLGPDVEVLLPHELRDTMAGIGRRIADLHGPQRHSSHPPP